MAPARMIQFIKNHVASCEVCQADPDLPREIEKITEIILPESKIPKAVRLQQEEANEEPEEEKVKPKPRVFKAPIDDDDNVESSDDEENEDDEYIHDDDDAEEELLDDDFDDD